MKKQTNEWMIVVLWHIDSYGQKDLDVEQLLKGNFSKIANGGVCSKLRIYLFTIQSQLL